MHRKRRCVPWYIWSCSHANYPPPTPLITPTTHRRSIRARPHREASADLSFFSLTAKTRGLDRLAAQKTGDCLGRVPPSDRSGVVIIRIRKCLSHSSDHPLGKDLVAISSTMCCCKFFRQLMEKAVETRPILAISNCLGVKERNLPIFIGRTPIDFLVPLWLLRSLFRTFELLHMVV